jgi:hypothetical protein
MFFRIQRALVVVGAASVVVAAAPAADAMTVRVGNPNLIGRVAMSVPVTVSCTPFDPAFTYFADSVFVSVQQAAGHDIATGGGSAFGNSNGQPPLLFPCDGTEQALTVPVTAGSRPFHGGQAVINATASAMAGQPCFPGSTG